MVNSPEFLGVSEEGAAEGGCPSSESGDGLVRCSTQLSYTDPKSMTGLEPATVWSNEVTVACAPGTHHELRLPRSRTAAVSFSIATK
jgi:hypothetical protein